MKKRKENQVVYILLNKTTKSFFIAQGTEETLRETYRHHLKMRREYSKNLRTRAGMTQRQLAKELHIGLSAIGMYERGRRTPSVEILIQMSNFFGVSLDYLITGKEFSAPNKENNVSTHPTRPRRSRCPCCSKNV